MGTLALFNGFYTEVLLVTLWGTVIAVTFGTCYNLAVSNGKVVLGVIIILFYISIFFVSSIVFNFDSSENTMLHFITQAKSMFVLLPLMVGMLVITHYFGMFCYKTRNDEKRKTRDEKLYGI